MTGKSQYPSGRFDKVVIASGHMIDTPDREKPRFPATKAEAVRREIGRQLDGWNVGEGDLAICGGASGGDILFAEECLQRRARLRLFLAQNVNDFVRDSVRPAEGDWVRRFHALRAKAEVASLPEDFAKELEESSIYARTNLWIIDTAHSEVAEAGKLCALLVWDETPTGDGPGGTSDFATRVHDLGGRVAIINPTNIP